MKMMKGKKAMMDDLFDLIYMVIGAIFIIFFMGVIISLAPGRSDKETTTALSNNQNQQAYLLLKRGELLQQETVDSEIVKNEIKQLQQRDCLYGSKDFPCPKKTKINPEKAAYRK